MKRGFSRRLVCWFGTAALVPILAAGCGGSGEVSDATVAPDPSISLPVTKPAPSGKSAPAAGEAAPEASAAPREEAAPEKGAGWGTLKGRIVYGGDPPAPKVLQEKGKAVKDPEMCAVDAPILSERLVVDSATKGVRYALVYLSRPTAVNDDARREASASTVLFTQKKCTFEPHVLAVMAGVPIDLRSNDPKNHNVNVRLSNTSFNQNIAGRQSFRVTPTLPERSPGRVVCDVHPWMTAWWMVLDHPYFAVTNARGEFEIKHAPSGSQKVVVWQEAVGFVTPPAGDSVTITAGEDCVKNVTIDPAKVRPGE